MPNHISNNTVIIGSPESIRRFINEALRVPTDEQVRENADLPGRIIDFDRIIPMPPELRNTVSPLQFVDTQEEADRLNAEYNTQPIAKFMGGDEPREKYITTAEAQRRLAEYGATDWYDWSNENWGTKWGAYDHTHYELRFFVGHDDEAETYGRVDLRFDTAWSQPTPIFEKIKERWDVNVHAVSQDEGGFPDTEYGNPYNEEVLRKVVTFEFDSWDKQVEEPSSNLAGDNNG